MKSSRIYLVCVILSLLVVSSLSDDEKSSKNDSPSEGKKKSSERPGQRQKQKNRKTDFDIMDADDIDEFNGFSSSYADNRYTAAAGSEGNYRTRPRWQQQQQQPQPQQQQLSLRFPPSVVNDWEDEVDYSGIEFPYPGQSNLSPKPLANPWASDNGPTCYSLVDSQYPIFSDICGAVPQARYSLPNVFGIQERWQIAQILSNIVSSSAEPSCTRSIRLLLCPVLFPPCQSRQETPAVLPCQSYCRAVKSQCSIPALDALPCEALPYSSDICPTNQAYGSFIPQAPVNQQSSSNQQLSRALASLKSILASQHLQAQLNSAFLSQQNAQNQFNPSALSQQASQSPLNLAFLTQQSSPSQLNSASFSQQAGQSQFNPTSYSQQAAESQFNPASFSQQGAQSQFNPTSFSQQAAESQYNPAFLTGQNSQTRSQQQQQHQQQHQQANPSAGTTQGQSQTNPLLASQLQAQQQQQQQQTLNAHNPYSNDGVSALYSDYASQSNGYGYPQNQRYSTPLTRSSNEGRVQPERRRPTGAYPRGMSSSAAVPTGIPSGIPSLVKA